MAEAFLVRPATADDLGRLQAISADARKRYASIPSLAHVMDSPALGLDRFERCRIIVAVNQTDGIVVGFAMTRLLDDLLYLDNISVASGESGRGIGSGLLSETLSHARGIAAPAVTLTTFRAPAWNGPWFRLHRFEPMPPEEIGQGLADVLKRQSQTLDPQVRETLWHRCQGED